MRLKRDVTHVENRFPLSPKRTSPFKSAGASLQKQPKNSLIFYILGATMTTVAFFNAMMLRGPYSYH